jgi:osmotically-inducible protein OsmY
MRLFANGGVVVMTAVVLAGCDTNRVDDAATAPDATANTASAVHGETDALVTTRVQAKFFADDRVKGHRIDVDTADGVVTLTGNVDSDTQRQAAEEIARGTDGVRRVENRLAIRQAGDQRVIGSTGAPAGSAREGGEGSPAWITTKIQSQFYVNPELKPWRIDVDTSPAGVVTLRGAVDSEDDHAEAVRIARSTEGVTRVNDQLRVEAQAAATTGTGAGVREEGREARDDLRQGAQQAVDTIEDGWITAKIQSKYFVDDDVRARNIDVDTTDGMVTLKGSVASEGERHQAVAIAKSTDGVKMVHDNLVVDRSMDASRRDTSPRGTTGTRIDDPWITTKIQSKYFLHDDIKARRVDVDTKSGIVTLNGSVPSDAAKQAAEVIAQDTDGVVKVVNNLTVESR